MSTTLLRFAGYEAYVGRGQVEAVENHMPEVVIVDEIGTEAEALACRTIAGTGIRL
jgi:stage III sporulation protein SpoIIIAA